MGLQWPVGCEGVLYENFELEDKSGFESDRLSMGGKREIWGLV